MVKVAWGNIPENVQHKLDRVIDDSIVFNRDVFGNIFKIKRRVESRLRGIHGALERMDLVSLLILEQQLHQEYNEVLFREETLWYQKSRENWVHSGDRSTYFFHAQTVIKRKRNKIRGLNIPGGIWCTDDVILQQEAQKFFKGLFCSNMNSNAATFHTNLAMNITEEDKCALNLPITKAEVFHAISSMKAFKAPGLDGFPTVFYKQYWDIVGDDMWNMVSQAFEIRHFDSNIAETLIALILKVDHPKSFKEFRPISLCNVSYKLISKVIVNRLKPILSRIIGPQQSSFLPGRGTQDNAIILQEILHKMQKSKAKLGDLVFKIDLEKAYDHVDWNFLESCLQDFGLPGKLIDLIMFCVTSSSLSSSGMATSYLPLLLQEGYDKETPYLLIFSFSVWRN